MDQAVSLSPFERALRLGDDALVLSHRLCEWCGHAPSLEIDLALSNIGLDLLGQAQFFLALAGELEGAGRDVDALAYHREEHDFTNLLLAEQPNGDFARTMLRQFLLSAWQEQNFTRMAAEPEERFAAIAAKALKEVTYHANFAADWVIRLGDGTPESHRRLTEAIAWCWRFTDELFEGEESGLRPAWEARLRPVMTAANLDWPAPVRGLTGGRAGRHTEHLGPMLATMQYLQRCHPGAQW